MQPKLEAGGGAVAHQLTIDDILCILCILAHAFLCLFEESAYVLITPRSTLQSSWLAECHVSATPSIIENTYYECMCYCKRKPEHVESRHFPCCK